MCNGRTSCGREGRERFGSAGQIGMHGGSGFGSGFADGGRYDRQADIEVIRWWRQRVWVCSSWQDDRRPNAQHGAFCSAGTKGRRRRGYLSWCWWCCGRRRRLLVHHKRFPALRTTHLEPRGGNASFIYSIWGVAPFAFDFEHESARQRVKGHRGGIVAQLGSGTPSMRMSFPPRPCPYPGDLR